LYEEKKELQIKELSAAIKKSGKSYEEVLRFVRDENF